jgi:hypothetical protein
MVSFLFDLFVDTFLSVFDTASDRAIVGSFAIVSTGITAVHVWMLTVMSDPIPQTDWGGFVVVVAGLLSGAPGLLVSYLHFVRNEFDRAFAWLCLAANGAAVSLSVFALVAR